MAMAALKNPKHEAVACAYFADPQRNGPRAYKSIYSSVSDRGADTCFSRLLKSVEFQSRIVEFQQLAVDKSVMSGLEVLQELTKIGRSDMRHYMKVGTDGQPVLDWCDLSPEQTAVIQEVTVEEFTDGRSDKREVRRVKFKLVPKIPALELLGKHHGLLAEKLEVRHSGTILHTLLKEIDAESREIVTIEARPVEQEEDVL